MFYTSDYIILSHANNQSKKIMAKKFSLLAFVFFFLIMQAWPGHGRTFADISSSFMVYDGVDSAQKLPFISLFSSDSSCEETYGFLPCTNTVLGNIFLILVYGFLMFFSAKMLSDGSEILLHILGPGIIGGLFLPLLSSIPDSAIILASGLSGSKETAQSQVSVGMGLMAGSTVLLLTLLWGSCLIVGKCDIENSKAVDSKDTKRFSLTESGVTTDIWTSYAARIMVISVIPFIIAQLPQELLYTTSQSRLPVLLSLIVSIALLICYSLYQILQPWIQKRRIAYARHKQIVSGILRDFKTRVLGRLSTADGEPDRDVISRLFNTIDENSDGYLTTAELKALIIGIQFEELDIDINDAVDQLLKDFDTSLDSQVDLDEFFLGISKWLNQAKNSESVSNGHKTETSKLLSALHQQTTNGEDLSGELNDEVPMAPGILKWNATKAGLMLLLGTIIAAVFADPLVDAVDNFSTASSISTFFVSFVILPFASCSEVVSDLIFASRKKSRSTSLAYSEIYGSVTMSNVLSLAVFLGLVYFRDLTWDFSSEVLVILIVCVVMGVIASFRTTFPLWIALVAYALYPFSLLLTYFLINVLGWD